MSTPRGPHAAPARLRRRGAPFPVPSASCSPGSGASEGPGPGRPCDPGSVPLASTRFPCPVPEPLRPSQPSRSHRELPYHCGCTAQAESPARPAGENMVIPGLLKVDQPGLTAPARKLPHAPRPPRGLIQSRFFPQDGTKPRERWGGAQASEAPPPFEEGICPTHPRQPCSASGQPGAGLPKVVAAEGAMGKSDFLTPKAIANRIKSKGLQKLRWYCQMCQKQCRDEVSGPGAVPCPPPPLPGGTPLEMQAEVPDAGVRAWVSRP